MRKLFTTLFSVVTALLFTFTAFAQDISVKGKVTDQSNGESLIGVSIKVKGSTTGTTTDVNGNYSVSAPPNGTLVFSYLGFQEQQVPINNRTTINVGLEVAAQQLQQVVVVGYGTQRKVDVTGSVSQVSGSDIAKQSSPNAVSALQGRVAGVQITNSGAPGSSPQIRVRGLGTVYGNPNPLYVVDGVWFDDISFLNPEDIENISILKDASSQSIYGIRAANGVVLVTTKKGKEGRSALNYNGYVGMQRVTNMLEMADASEYATLLNEKSVLSGGADLVDPSGFGAGTDWYNVVLRNAITHNHQFSVSGGSERSTYNFSLGYLDQDGVVETHNFKRFTARLQNDFQVLKGLKAGYMVTGASIKSDDINSNVVYQSFVAPPIIPVRYADGSYGDPADYPTGNFANPQVTLDYFDQNSKNNRLTGNAYAELTFLKNFTFRTSFGGEFGQGEVLGYVPIYNATSVQQNINNSRLNISRAETRNWIIENTLTFNKLFNQTHNVTIMAGQAAQRYRSYSISASALDVPRNSDGDLYLRLGSSGNSTITDAGDLSTVASYFSRANYSYKGRYLLNASLRADGSSKFSGDQRWGYFPSVGAGWLISDEQFMKDQQVVNTLKLRGSWGKIGNASVPTNLSTLLVNQGAAFTAVFGGVPQTGASITTIVPPVTFWERGVGTDIGLEASFFDNRFTFEADWYNKKTEQAIFAVPILGSIGTTGSSLIANNADFQNRGFEFTASWKNNTEGDLNYTISGNMSINDNKVLSVATGENPLYAGGAGAVAGNLTTRTVLGQPIGQFFGYRVEGIYQTTEEVNSTPHIAGAKPGDFRYADVNGDEIIDARDRVVLGNPNPKYTYGINTNFNYKSFDLTLDFQGVAGVEIYNANKGIRFGNENYTKEFFDNRWTGPGSSNAYPSANLSGNNLNPSSYYVEDGSYFRVRNIQIGYTLPTPIAKRANLQRLRLYLNAQNAFNFFSYNGFSPEVGGTPTNAGIDNNVYPMFATYNFGINLSF
jgi:TonB-linked SusC/RagA family outer membrane protein